MVTQDVRMELIQHEYTGARNALHTLMDRMDGYESAVLGLTEAVSQNSDQIQSLTNIVTENRNLILDNQRQIADLHEKVDRLMTHLDVPPKPPAGFVKE